eukprot:jgi/Botrbrau1/21936/Bobra.0249s0059.1
MGTVLDLALKRYLKQLQKNPVRTKAITAASLFGTSDIVAQLLTRSSSYNWRRTVAIALYGLIWSGPAGHFWQQLVERVFGPKKDPQTLVKKVLLDSVVWSPFANALAMIYFTTVVEGRTLAFTRSKLKQEFPTVQLNAWRVWPLVSLINFRYMPLELRVVFHNCVAFFWAIFLILKSSATLTARKRLA